MILVVDDSTLITDWMREVIQGAGYYFDSAVDGPSALYKMTRIYYPLALIDIILPPPISSDGGPVMSGDELARQIKTLPEPYSSTPLIGISGGDFQEEVKPLFVDCLHKPFLPQQLLEKIHQHARPPIRDLHRAMVDAGLTDPKGGT